MCFIEAATSILKTGKTFFGYERFFPPFFGNEEKENLLMGLRKKKLIQFIEF